MEREPIYSYTAAKPGDKDIGDTYVEIDLGKQHLYLYVDKKMILESDFVSGNASRGWNTPAGVFGLTYKNEKMQFSEGLDMKHQLRFGCLLMEILVCMTQHGEVPLEGKFI